MIFNPVIQSSAGGVVHGSVPDYFQYYYSDGTQVINKTTGGEINVAINSIFVVVHSGSQVNVSGGASLLVSVNERASGVNIYNVTDDFQIS